MSKRGNVRTLKSLLTVVVLTIACFESHSQIREVGLKGGAFFSRLNVDNTENEDRRNGYQIGGFVEFSLKEDFAIETGIFYQAKGTRFENTGNRTERVGQVNVNYLSLPIVFKYNFLKYFDINSGIYSGYLLTVNFTREGNDGQSRFNPLERDNIKNFDLGFIIGVSFNFSAIHIGYQYSRSFGNQLNSDNAIRLLGEAKNTVSQVSIGFNLKYSK